MKLKFALLLPALMVAFMSTHVFAEDQNYKQAKIDWYDAIETFVQKVKVAEGVDYHASENSNLWAALDVEVKRLADEKENVNKGSFFFLCKAHKKVMRQFHNASYDFVKLGSICSSSGSVAENLGAQESDTTGAPITSELEALRVEAYKGDVYAQYKLGQKYFEGDGLPEDAAKAVEWWQKAAAQGHAASQYNLGVMYVNGIGVPKDVVKAIIWYEKSAVQGHAKAQVNLGVIYDRGNGVPKDIAKAIVWYEKAAAQGLASAQYNLGVTYDEGDNIPRDAVKAAQWFQKAAEQGHADAQYNLGVMYAKGDGVLKDEAKAVEWYEKAAAQGDVEAQYNLGFRLERGLGTPKNLTGAVEWYQKAAVQGHLKSQKNLGYMLERGLGAPKDLSSAAEWYQMAAEQGDVETQYYLGLMYSLGDGVSKDASKAAEWFEKAATKGHADAQSSLGVMYAQGSGVQEDTTRAVYWLQKAAAQEHAYAQTLLGSMYNEGTGVPKDTARAFDWLQKAAAQGFALGQLMLSKQYILAEQSSENLIRSYAWANLAAAQGDQEAKNLRITIEKVLNAAQRAEGQRLASDWKKGDTFKTVRHIPNSPTQPTQTTENAPLQKNTGSSASWKSFYKHNGVEHFIDTSSIRKADGLTYAWETVEVDMVDENNAKVRQTVVINHVINCNTHRVASGSIKLIVRNKNGDVVKNGTLKANESEFLATEPDSPGDRLVNFACAANVAAQTGGSSNSSGSGFFVSSSGYLLTNNHVVNGCTSLKIRDSSKIEHDITVVATDAKSDLALLKTNKPVALPSATFRANGSVESGESVVALGYPLAGLLASEVNVSFGYVSATAGLADDTSKLQISAPVQPGNSGGPLLDQAGNLIGVVVAKLDAVKVAKAIGDIPQNINFAVKGEVAQVFLKAHKVKFKTATASKKLENTDIANRGRAFTVLVECYK